MEDNTTTTQLQSMVEELIAVDNEYITKMSELFDKHRDLFVLEPQGEIISALEVGGYDSVKLTRMKFAFMSDLLGAALKGQRK